MISFFRTVEHIYAVQTLQLLAKEDITKLLWLFDGATPIDTPTVEGNYLGPRSEMISPWSTNAVEIIQNMGIKHIARIEEFSILPHQSEVEYDPMLQRLYKNLHQKIFTIDKQPAPIIWIDDIVAYNNKEGLALSTQEIAYLCTLSQQLGRKLTDSEVFGFSQVNSEHCRHKIFNGQFIIDGQEKEHTLFEWIKKTTTENANKVISAYKDNVSFCIGPIIEQFAPKSGNKPDFFTIKKVASVLSLKAETHNFPTTVEPFNGAATGSGGEIRDRLAGGKGSLPLAGTAVYMTSYPRNDTTLPAWQQAIAPRKWLYQSPEQILIKASNGASDFGNKFGQPLICGSLLTFEHQENGKKYGFDKVIMLAGGIGYATLRDVLKAEPTAQQKIVVMGGDNYRIGMGGAAVSSVQTGDYDNTIELNAVQRANPEMQKRVANVIRALVESEDNPIVSIHDHGAGGHLNCLLELVEKTGGIIDIEKLPVGDTTLSAKEIIGNESQERMGMIIAQKDIDAVQQIAERERAPMYVVGETTDDMQFVFQQTEAQNPIDLPLHYMIGKPPRMVITDQTIVEKFAAIEIDETLLLRYIENVLQVESVACKDWLTNKVDRSVTGKVARQQCAGEIQLPLNDLGAVALDYQGTAGMATAIGHAPLAAMINPVAGSMLAIAEALTNIVWAPLEEGLQSVSLSANWMWPCKNHGEDARLYKAVEACSDFACALGVNIPTGKDSLSMTQNYGNDVVLSPGTVIISASAEVSDIKKIVGPVAINDEYAAIYYINFSSDDFELGGSVLGQTLNKIGEEPPTIKDIVYFKKAFDCVQQLVKEELVLAGHDISAGGMITALLEMTFGNTTGGLKVTLDDIAETSLVKILFAENTGVLIQVKEQKKLENILQQAGVKAIKIANPINERMIKVIKGAHNHLFPIDILRDKWFRPSYLLDRKQSGEACAKERYENYASQKLLFNFSTLFTGKLSQFNLSPQRVQSGVTAAIIREKGTNGEREMAYALYLAGFDVKDVHTTDLISGRETLEGVQCIVFCGGFSNSDVLGSAKGWAGGLLFNEKAKQTLDNFYQRTDTLSLGICNGCQLMVALDLINPEHKIKARMLHNDSHKFESAFVGVTIPENHSVMLGSLSGSKLGIWVAHGEGKFSLPQAEEDYHIVAKYSYDSYPANPNGSDYNVAGICSADGRHLAMMPHLERAIFPWQWAHYPTKQHEVSPWIEAFVNAKHWIEKHLHKDEMCQASQALLKK